MSRARSIRSRRTFLRGAALAVAVCCLTAATARAEFPYATDHHGEFEDPYARSGYSHLVAPWAKWAYGPKYAGYYVGGGAPLYGHEPGHFHGEPRYPFEGTWGLDYGPWYSRVRLQWYHGTRLQGGRGQYEPDHKNNPLENLFHD